MIDRRVRRTQALLVNALIALTLEKGYNAITIRDITDRADIGYATFFRHYSDKDALLRDTLDVFLNELMDLLPPFLTNSDTTRVGTLLFRYVQEHSELVQVLLSSSTMVDYVVTTTTKHILSQGASALRSTIPPDIAAFHLVNTSISLIHWWLNHKMPYPPEQMGNIYFELILHPSKKTDLEEQ